MRDYSNACGGAHRYQGVRPPRCNGGNPCKRCTAKYKEVQAEKAKKIKQGIKEGVSKKIAELMAEAKVNRAENYRLIEEVRSDPSRAKAVKALLCADLRRVFAIPRELIGPSASRPRYREHGHYSEALVTYLIGDWAEFKRQAKIEDSLGVRTVRRNISKTTRAQDVMHYAEKHVKPWNGAYDFLDLTQDSILIQVGSDFHSKFGDPFARRVWMDVAKKHQPDGVRYNGDVPDFPKLSRHRQLPGHFALDLQNEINLGVKLFADTREVTPDADHKYILGNHDIRLITALADATPIFSSLDCLNFGELFKLDDLQIGLVARPSFLNPSAKMRKRDISQNWETIANLFTIVHGFLTGKDAPRKHMARFMRYGTNAHLHDPQMISGGSDATGVHQWWQTPCMAHPPALAAEYMPGPIDYSGWAAGFGMFRLFPKHGFVTGHIIVVDEIAEYCGDIWTITDEERLARQLLLEI
jgi:hypothetical protein